MNSGGKKTVIGVVYRSPKLSATNIEKLFNCIHELSHRDLVIMGDFNYPNIDWENLHANSDCSDFLDLVLDNFSCQLVFFPTREENAMDLFLTSDPSMMNSIECVGKLGSSDHVLI